jgi:hypothetical protein
MPTIESWDKLPANVRQHLVDRMRERAIGINDLNQLRLWIATQPDVPATGTKISVPSKSAVVVRTPRRFCYATRSQKAKLFDKAGGPEGDET